MPRQSKQPPRYFEPWYAAQSRTWEVAYRFKPSCFEPEEDAKWEANKGRDRQRADWLVYARGLTERVPVVSLLGKESVTSGDEVVLIARTFPSTVDDPPSHEQVAKRVVACVNALAGVVDPEDTLDRARRLLLD